MRPDIAGPVASIRVVIAADHKILRAGLAHSENTVKHHLSNIFDTLGVSNRLELPLFATSHQLVMERTGRLVGPTREEVNAGRFRTPAGRRAV